MGTTTPLTLTPIPVGTDPANVPSDLLAAASWLERFAVPRYTNAADRTAKNPTPVLGQFAWLLDLACAQVFNGTSWVTLSLPSQVTDTTRPPAPYMGQVIFETNTGLWQYWTGTAWTPLAAAPVGAPIAYTPTITIVGATVTSPLGWYRRTAGALDIWGSWTVTAGAAGAVSVSLPAGFTANGFTGTVLAGTYGVTGASNMFSLLVAAGASALTCPSNPGATGAHAFHARVPLAS